MARYEVRIAHECNRAMCAAFEGLEVVRKGQVTVLRGDLDQAALHGVLEWLRVLRLELIDVRRIRTVAGVTVGSRAVGQDSPPIADADPEALIRLDH